MRASIVDLFLDTPECNAHTTAADVVWSGTPVLTWAKWPYKMCSRMASSIVASALPPNEEGERARSQLLVSSEQQYEDTAVELGRGLTYRNTLQGTRHNEIDEEDNNDDDDVIATCNVTGANHDSHHNTHPSPSLSPASPRSFSSPSPLSSPSSPSSPSLSSSSPHRRPDSRWPGSGRRPSPVATDQHRKPEGYLQAHAEVDDRCHGLGRGRGRLMELRRLLWEGRWESRLFDTKRWVRDVETAYEAAWSKWVKGEGGNIWL